MHLFLMLLLLLFIVLCPFLVIGLMKLLNKDFDMNNEKCIQSVIKIYITIVLTFVIGFKIYHLSEKEDIHCDKRLGKTEQSYNFMSGRGISGPIFYLYNECK